MEEIEKKKLQERRINSYGGEYILALSEQSLRSLYSMIRSANLEERREWNAVKEEIEKIIKL